MLQCLQQDGKDLGSHTRREVNYFNSKPQEKILSFAVGSEDKCYSNSCYKFFETGKTWKENRNTCKSEGGDLVSMETETEWKYVNHEIQEILGVNEWHIGLQKQGGRWKWVSGQDLNMEKWQPNEPSGNGNEAAMAKNYPPGSQGLFNDLPGFQPRPFICEIPNGKLIFTIEGNWGSKKPAPAVHFFNFAWSPNELGIDLGVFL